MEENNVNVAQTTQPNYEGVQVNAPQQGVSQAQVEYTTPQTFVNDVHIQEQPQNVQVQSEPVQQVPVQEAPQVEQPQLNVELSGNYIKLKTELLKEGLKKADAVASKLNTAPITEIVEFKVSGNVLNLRATDRENIITVYVPVMEATDGLQVTLKIGEIKPLVDKLPSGDLAIFENNGVVKLVAVTGEYNFNQAYDLTTNKLITVPDVDVNLLPIEETVEINGTSFMSCIETVLPLVSSFGDDDSKAAIHFGEFVSASTGNEVAVAFENYLSIFNTTIFMKATTAKALLSMGVGEKVNMGVGTISSAKTTCIYTNDYRLFSVQKENEDEYALEVITDLVNASKGTTIKINKDSLLSSIERLKTMFSSSISKQSLSVESATRNMKISNESKAFENLVISGTSDAKLRLDVQGMERALKSVKGNDIVIDTIVLDGDMTSDVSMIKISDGKTSWIIGTAL